MRPSLPPRPKPKGTKPPGNQAQARAPSTRPGASNAEITPAPGEDDPLPVSTAAGPRQPPLPPAAPPVSGMAALPPEAAAAMQQAMQALASGQHPGLLQQVSGKMGLSEDQIRQTAAAIASGRDAAIPQEVVQRAMQLQWALRSGALPPMGAAAASAVPPGMPPGLLGTLPPGAGGPAGPHMAGAGMGGGDGGELGVGPSSSSSTALLLEGEDQQGWLELYRRAYGRHLDFIFPPLYIASASLALWSGLLPFWLALFLVPAGLLFGVHLCLVKGGGIPVPLLPFSRMPAALVATLEVLAISTFFLQMWPELTGLTWRCLLFALLAAAALFLHFRCYKRDPGYLEAKGQPQPMTPAQRMYLSAQNPAWCYTCNIYRPIRSKHCSTCDRCVSEFDHHCPVVSNCVGEGNCREFLGYLLTLWGAELMWLHLALYFWRRVVMVQVLQTHVLPSTWQAATHITALASLWPGTLYTHLLVLFIFGGTSLLAARQAACAAANLTTNELLSRHKYGYLKAADGASFANVFDEGPAANCVQFWSTARPDWYALYSKRQPQLEGPSWQPSQLSFSALVRRWDEAKAALHASRLAKRRRREQWLLQQYGGVRPETAEQQQLMATANGACSHAGCSSCESSHVHA